jgi:hypothetical protein
MAAKTEPVNGIKADVTPGRPRRPGWKLLIHITCHISDLSAGHFRWAKQSRWPISTPHFIHESEWDRGCMCTLQAPELGANLRRREGEQGTKTRLLLFFCYCWITGVFYVFYCSLSFFILDPSALEGRRGRRQCKQQVHVVAHGSALYEWMLRLLLGSKPSLRKSLQISNSFACDAACYFIASGLASLQLL